MAAVLDALAPYVTKLIADIVEEEVSMLLGVSEEITELGGKTETMEAYMADAERRHVNDVRVQKWVSKLKSALYEATDVLELCQLDTEEAQEKKAPGCLQPLLFCLRNPSVAHGLGDRIKKLNASLDSIHKEMADFEFVKLDAYKLRTPRCDAAAHSRTTTSLLDESAVVGDAIEVETKAVVQELLDDEPAIKVVSITGPGGMGKTTLVKNILNDKEIQEEFSSKIWLSVTEKYNARDLLSSAITLAAGGEKDPRGNQEVLTHILVNTLSAGKFLLVMDDVWSNMPWADVLQSPVLKAGHRQPGSRVIITARNQHLVKDMGAAYCLRHVKPLSDEDAWSLLKKQLPDVGGERALDRLKDIGIEIIRNCDGLPLAIKAIGGLLRMKRATEHEWKVVLHDPSWKTDITHTDLNSALRLSYEDLSPAVKQCFLYFSLIPKGFYMARGDVIGMWNVEGFLEMSPSIEGRWKEMEGIGISYYQDLIARNLIEPEGEDYGQGPRCAMHDIIRSFARYMAKEEALVNGSGQISSLVSSPKLRHLCIEGTESESNSEASIVPDWSSIFEKQEFLRSLIICDRMKFERNTSDCWFSRFPSLRVIFLFESESDRFLWSLGKLKHLRFLLLWRTDVSRLPDEIGKMRFLEHIHIQKCGNFDGQIPSSMLKLERLRYLSIVQDTNFTVPKGFSGLTSLRMLRDFPVQIDEKWCSLQEVGSLSLLRTLELGNLGVVPSSSLAAMAKIRDKEQLRSLTLRCYVSDDEGPNIDEVTEEDFQQVEEVFNELCPPPQLQELYIRGYIGCRLPRCMCTPDPGVSSSMDFNSLTNLVLSHLPFCRELPNGLCRLPSLETLDIFFALAVRCIGAEFQRLQTGGSSNDIMAARMSFPRLQSLDLSGLPKWEEWEWEEEDHDSIAMPSLHKLNIRKCKLGCLPAGLASILRRLDLKELVLDDIAEIAAVENFTSVVMLDVRSCPSLKMIRGFPRMQRVYITGPALDTVELCDQDMKTLPEYLRGLKPRILRVYRCHQELADLLSAGSDDDSSSAQYRAEMDKVQQCVKFVVL
ncbi:hypothetical protein BS78_05G272900 [Paspalum vaginatum]|nr:hypothetical protein BS78_05G272900 [Paspalum vaginatum]